jgi:hypothetical protein
MLIFQASSPSGNKSSTYSSSSCERPDASGKNPGRSGERSTRPGLPPSRAAEQSASQGQPTQPGRDSSSTTSTGSTESSSRPGVRRSTSGNKTRPTVVASGSRGKTKPTLIRRKSSQSKSQQGNAPRLSQPALRSPTASTGSQEDKSGGARSSNNLREFCRIWYECH